MKPIFRITLIVSVVTILSSTALAQGFGQRGQGGGPGGAMRAACKQDVQSYCSEVQPGGGRIIGCLKDHYKEVSDSCYNALNKMQTMKDKRGGQGADNGGMQPPPPPPQDGNRPPSPPHQGGGEPPSPPGGDMENNDGSSNSGAN